MFLNIVFLIIFWLVGTGLYSIGIMQIILCLFCAIPLTKLYKPQCKHIVDSSGLYKRFTMTIIFWGIISAAAITALFYFGNTYMKIGFGIGLVIAFFLSLGKWGATPANTLDYFKAYHRYYAENDLVSFGVVEAAE